MTRRPTKMLGALDLRLGEVNSLNLTFLNSNYTATLYDTYVRTIEDAHRLLGPDRKRVLESGAFAGVVSVTLAQLGYDVTAADVPLVMNDVNLRSYLENNNVTPLAARLEELPYPFPADSFDLILCCEVIEHLPFNPIPVLREMRRMVKPGGFVYIATPNLTSLNHRISMLRGQSFHNTPRCYEIALDPSSDMSVGLHWKECSRDELVECCRLAGMRCVEHYYCRYVSRTASTFWRRVLVGALYRACPSLMQCQVAVLRKRPLDTVIREPGSTVASANAVLTT